MVNNIAGALIALALGCLISYINYRISAVILNKKPDIIAASSVVRQIVNVAYLAAVYFIAPLTPFSLVYLLVGAVIGLTCSMFYFTYRLIKKTDNKNGSGGGEN